MFWDSGYALLRIAAVGVPMYFLMIAALRITGKRALAKMNAYDLVITVSLGSVLASTFLQKDIRLADGVLALGLMLALQYLVATCAQRWPWIQDLVLERPSLLLYDGKIIRPAMKAQRITESELLSAVRSHGHVSLRQIRAVVLEPDGTFSVMAKRDEPDALAMKTVGGFPKSLAQEPADFGEGSETGPSRPQESQATTPIN